MCPSLSFSILELRKILPTAQLDLFICPFSYPRVPLTKFNIRFAHTSDSHTHHVEVPSLERVSNPAGPTALTFGLTSGSVSPPPTGEHDGAGSLRGVRQNEEKSTTKQYGFLLGDLIHCTLGRVEDRS